MRSADAIGDGDHVHILPRYSEAKAEFEFATRLAAEQFVEAEKREHRPGRRRKVA
jgi:diadenosine tetraphosphate (Ap4A) HIT family hydrolase